MFHNVKIRVFEREEKDEDVLKGVEALTKLNLKEEKLSLEKVVNKGLENKQIFVYTLDLTKKRHVRSFVESINEEIEDKSFKDQENRLDDELRFFLRFDKEKLLNNEFKLVEHGDCFHVTCQVAAYPKKKEIAREVIKEVFK